MEITKWKDNQPDSSYINTKAFQILHHRCKKFQGHRLRYKPLQAIQETLMISSVDHKKVKEKRKANLNAETFKDPEIQL